VSWRVKGGRYLRGLREESISKFSLTLTLKQCENVERVRTSLASRFKGNKGLSFEPLFHPIDETNVLTSSMLR